MSGGRTCKPDRRMQEQGQSEGLTSVAFSPDGKTLASGGQDSAIILWDVPSVSGNATP